METLQISKTNVLKAFKNAKAEGKDLLSDLFGKEVLSGKITDRIKTFADACEAVREDPNQSKFNTGSADDIAYQRLKVVVRALNEGWTPDWNNSNQYKWYPWFYLDKPGFRFYGAGYAYAYSHATCGSRLCFSSEELAKYAANQFLDLYKDFLS